MNILISYRYTRYFGELLKLADSLKNPIKNVVIISDTPTQFNHCSTNYVIDKDLIAKSLGITTNPLHIKVYIASKHLCCPLPDDRDSVEYHNWLENIPSVLGNINFDIAVHGIPDGKHFIRAKNNIGVFGVSEETTSKILGTKYEIRINGETVSSTYSFSDFDKLFLESFTRIANTIITENGLSLEERFAELYELVSEYLPIKMIRELKEENAKMKILMQTDRSI